MTVFPLMCALKRGLVQELSDFLLPDADRNGSVSYPSLPPAVYIGSLPSKTDENQVPFVLIQDLGGSLLSDKVQSVKIAFRCAVQAEDIEDACEDLHNLMSRVASYCAGTQTVPLEVGTASVSGKGTGSLTGAVQTARHSPTRRASF